MPYTHGEKSVTVTIGNIPTYETAVVICHCLLTYKIYGTLKAIYGKKMCI